MAATRAFNKAGAKGDLEVELGKGNRQEGQQQLTTPPCPTTMPPATKQLSETTKLDRQNPGRPPPYREVGQDQPDGQHKGP